MRIVTLPILLASVILGAVVEAVALTSQYGGELLQTIRFAVLDIFWCVLLSGLWIACWGLVASSTAKTAIAILVAVLASSAAVFLLLPELGRDRGFVGLGFVTTLTSTVLLSLRYRRRLHKV